MTKEQLKSLIIKAKQSQKYDDYQTAGVLLIVEDVHIENNIVTLLDKLCTEDVGTDDLDELINSVK